MENYMMDNTTNNEAPKRPMFLTVLCVLTFIASGIGTLTSLLAPLLAEQLTTLIQSAPNYDEVQMAEAVKVLNAGWGYYSIMFLLAAGSLIGAILMWTLKKVGFHIYTLSNLVALFVPMLMFSAALSWSGIFFTAIFIILYGLNFKHLK